MKELTIISGKGGTGKTSITGSFAALAKNKVMADCDVDAADLHLILKPEIIQRTDFSGGKVASINPDICTGCGKCVDVCQFKAISDEFVVDPISCEGCSVCVHFCPVNAIDFNTVVNGEWYISETRFGPMVHARLGIAEENSGKLVSMVRQQAKQLAEQRGLELILVDGAPGVGCPVISSLTGTNAVLIVTEPTLSGMHDLKRVVALSREHFNIPTYVCINKFDLNTRVSQQIETFCLEQNIVLAGKIRYDTVFTQAMIHEKTVVEYSQGEVTNDIQAIWNRLRADLNLNE